MVDVKKSTFAKGLGRPVSELPRSLVEKQDIYARGLVRFDETTALTLTFINTARGN